MGEDSIAAAARDLLAAFPGEIGAIYLLGSRALGAADPASDVDLGAVFRGTAPQERRRSATEFAKRLGGAAGTPFDVEILDEAEAALGLWPRWTTGRLVAGDDMLRGLPVRPAEELAAYFAQMAVYFPWAIRGRPETLRHPLAYPGAGEFFGYERLGIRVAEGDYRPGLRMLVNVVLSIANARLARFRGMAMPNKHLIAEAYRRSLGDDPWAGLVAEVDAICRVRARGEIPGEPAERQALADCCRRVLDLENEAVGDCLLDLPRQASARDPEMRRRARGIAARASSSSATHAAAIAAAIGRA